MCQQIIQFCSGSTKPLLVVGSLLTLVLAIAIGYTGCTTNAIYRDIDQTIAQNRALGYHLQLAAAAYLVLVALLGAYAAHFNQKHSVRALAIVTAINFALALAAIAMIPSSDEIEKLVEPKLSEMAQNYNFTDKWPQPELSASADPTAPRTPNETAGLEAQTGLVLPSNGTASGESSQKQKRAAPSPPTAIKANEPTKVWDSLQSRGCCGFRSAAKTWGQKLPKSCCSKPVPKDKDQICENVDQDHQQGCLKLISATSLNLFIVLALTALANLYLAAISGVCAYRTFHYNEASQSAYN